MNLEIALLLGQDGVTNGAIYALLALALVLVFSVTRVIFIPQGEFVAYGGLTLAALQAGRAPGTIWLLLVACAAVLVLDGWAAVRARSPRGLARVLAWNAPAARLAFFATQCEEERTRSKPERSHVSAAAKNRGRSLR